MLRGKPGTPPDITCYADTVVDRSPQAAACPRRPRRVNPGRKPLTMQSLLPTAPLPCAESVSAPPQIPSGAPHIVTSQRTDLDTQQEDQWESEGGLVGRSLDASQTPGRSLSTKAGSWRDDGYWTTGTILSLRAGGFGFIASDACGRPWALRF